MDAYDYLFVDDDAELLEALEAYEDGEAADRAMALYQSREEQRAFQRELIEQQGGSIDWKPTGSVCFRFGTASTSMSKSSLMVLQERNYNVNLRQEGNIIDQHGTCVPRCNAAVCGTRLVADRITWMESSFRVFWFIFGTVSSSWYLSGQRYDVYKIGGMVGIRVDTIFERLQQTLNSNEDHSPWMILSTWKSTTWPRSIVKYVDEKSRSKGLTKGIEGFRQQQETYYQAFATTMTTCVGPSHHGFESTAQDYPTNQPMRILKHDPQTGNLRQEVSLQEALALNARQKSGVPDCAVGAWRIS